MAILLQKRDIDMLKFTYAFRVVSFEQLRRRYFRNAFRTVAPRRIRQLEDAGLLEVLFTGKGHSLYKFVRITAKGWSATREQWGFEIDNPLWKSESPIHDLRFAELFFSLEKLSTFEKLFTENLLQSSSVLSEDEKLGALARTQSDGALLLRPPNSPLYLYAVEVEISKKSPERYREKLMDYYLASGVDGVLYISDSQATLDAVARADAQVRTHKTSKVHMALEKDVLASSGKITFQRAGGGAIELF